MAACVDCGLEIGIYGKLFPEGLMCQECASRKNIAPTELQLRLQAEEIESTTKTAKIEAILVTTAHTLQGIEVTKYLGFVSTECAYGMNMFKDMFANVRNLVGGRSAAVEDTMRDSRETVLLELKREAYAKGANAVIAVDLDYTQLGAGGNMMVLVTASGTAVVIEADEGVL